MEKRGRINHILLISFLLLFAPQSLFSQPPLPKNDLHKLPLHKDDLFPFWSSNGRMVFQSGKKGHQNIFLYSAAKDTAVVLTSNALDNSHPVWVPGKNAVVYSAGQGKSSRLFYLDLKTGKTKLLFRRNIASKEASFTPSRHLVVFSGFDDRTQRWQIFSYDFVYDNLNRLTKGKETCSYPVFSPDGKNIVYLARGTDNRTNLMIMNWYGENTKVIRKGVTGRACWSRDSWRIYFVFIERGVFTLSYLEKTGNSEVAIYHSPYPICCPAIGPENGELTFSMKKEGIFRIYTFSEQTGLLKGL